MLARSRRLVSRQAHLNLTQPQRTVLSVMPFDLSKVPGQHSKNLSQGRAVLKSLLALSIALSKMQGGVPSIQARTLQLAKRSSLWCPTLEGQLHSWLQTKHGKAAAWLTPSKAKGRWQAQTLLQAAAVKVLHWQREDARLEQTVSSSLGMED